MLVRIYIQICRDAKASKLSSSYSFFTRLRKYKRFHHIGLIQFIFISLKLFNQFIVNISCQTSWPPYNFLFYSFIILKLDVKQSSEMKRNIEKMSLVIYILCCCWYCIIQERQAKFVITNWRQIHFLFVINVCSCGETWYNRINLVLVNYTKKITVRLAGQGRAFCSQLIIRLMNTKQIISTKW